jgi:IS1 family transposase
MSVRSHERSASSVLAALVDGSSERAVERVTGVSRPSISKLALRLGAGAVHLHNVQARDLSCSIIENDEIWSYVGKKQARVDPAKDGPDVGEAYTFVGLAMPSRYVVAWKVGKRDQATADAFVADLRSRLVVMPAMTSDGFAPYVSAIGNELRPWRRLCADESRTTALAQLEGPITATSPRAIPSSPRKPSMVRPISDRATTAHIERHNGTMRHQIGRMRRLCYAFSPKIIEHHKRSRRALPRPLQPVLDTRARCA